MLLFHRTLYILFYFSLYLSEVAIRSFLFNKHDFLRVFLLRLYPDEGCSFVILESSRLKREDLYRSAPDNSWQKSISRAAFPISFRFHFYRRHFSHLHIAFSPCTSYFEKDLFFLIFFVLFSFLFSGLIPYLFNSSTLVLSVKRFPPNKT